MIDYDDPKEEERWCNEQRTNVERYLAQTGVLYGQIGEWPAWHLAPYISIWAIESKKAPGWIGWWVFSGDGPTDYVSAENIKHPRDAMRELGKRWKEVSEYMSARREHPSFNLGRPEEWPWLAPILAKRASIFLDWSNDERMWE